MPGPFIVIVPVKKNLAGQAPVYVTGLTMTFALVTMPGTVVAVGVFVGVSVFVAVGVLVGVGVFVGVLVAVLVGDGVTVLVAVGVDPTKVRTKILLL
jgi:hypothetical protein